MRIAEIFQSIQGEGMLVGMPSVFVRTSGCNLRCRFCDTPYTSWKPEGEQGSVESILAQVQKYATRHVVVTGGEPLVAPDIEGLCQALQFAGKHVTIETAATVYKPLAANLFSLSPKLANSTPDLTSGWAERHDRDRINVSVIRSFLLNHECQLKFVIDEPGDIHEVLALLKELPPLDAHRIFLMPQAVRSEVLVEKGLWIAELCQQYGFRLGPRLHIDLWGQARGK